MNRYGRLAQAHWVKWRPNELSQIPDQEEFFTRLGLDVEGQVEELAAAMAGDDPGGEDYLQKLGRLRMARLTAESQVLREQVLLPPEPGHPQAEDENQDTSTWPATTDWMPTELTPDHPAYHELDNDPGLRKVSAPPEDSQHAHPTGD